MLRWFPFIALIAACGASALPVQETLTFEWNGIEHRESRQVEGDIVTLRDEEDGFAVILDYERDMLVIINVTSKTCFFTSLGNVPVEKGTKVPFMVETVTNETTEMGIEERNGELIMFSVEGEIPASYIMLTNDDSLVVGCASGTSLSIQEKSTAKRGIFLGNISAVVSSVVSAFIFKELDLTSPTEVHYHTNDHTHTHYDD